MIRCWSACFLVIRDTASDEGHLLSPETYCFVSLLLIFVQKVNIFRKVHLFSKRKRKQNFGAISCCRFIFLKSAQSFAYGSSLK